MAGSGCRGHGGSLADCTPGDQHNKRACRLRASGRYGKYLRLLKNGQLKIDRGNIKRVAKHDGKFVVHSNDDTLSPENLLTCPCFP